ncbi:MAG: hypothetical protein RB191_02430 [Terriglobia bacterium]|nr:hypothetical protein [Terriglobia bacterium]
MKLSDALATIALLVAIASAIFTYVQTMAANSQIKLANLQVRPYVRLRPLFDAKQGDQLSVEEVTENFSSVPAHVIYSSLTPWVDGVTTGAFLFNRTGDILYENKPGVAVIPDMPKRTAKLVVQGGSRLEIGTCVLYGSISDNDPRRWESRAFYSYQPGSLVPEIQFVKEIEVASSTSSCESRNLRSQWLALGAHPIR